MEKENNPEYVVWFIDDVNRGYAMVSIYTKGKAPLLRDACVYRVKSDKETILRTYKPLVSVMQLAGDTLGNGDVRCELDRESILAVVPEWSKVI